MKANKIITALCDKLEHLINKGHFATFTLTISTAFLVLFAIVKIINL